MVNLPHTSLDAARLIQVALTPVFLLSGIAALLNVYAGRLARVADRLDALSPPTSESGDVSPHLAREVASLHRRSVMLDGSVVLATIGAAATCLNILTLFVLTLGDVQMAGVLLLFFCVAIGCTLGSVLAFGLEMLVSSRALRGRMRLHVPGLSLLLVLRDWRRR